MEIKNGFELSNMECVSLSVGVSKNANNDGLKSRFVVLGLRMYLYMGQRKRYFGGNLRHVLFEDELPGMAIETLAKYKAVNAQGAPLLDQKGGQVIDLQALKASTQDYELCEPFLDWPGGAVQTYKLKKGACYANDANGVLTRDKAGNPVVRESIDVLVQVVQYIDGVPNYAPGMSLEGRGQRIEARFWRTPVSQVQQPAQQVNPTPEPPTQQPAQTMPLGQQPMQQPGMTQVPDPNQPPF